jgi:hypothetical protein
LQIPSPLHNVRLDCSVYVSNNQTIVDDSEAEKLLKAFKVLAGQIPTGWDAGRYGIPPLKQIAPLSLELVRLPGMNSQTPLASTPYPEPR